LGAAAIAGALTLPYALPYIENVRALGPRGPGELASFSARLDSYFLAPEQNWLWGWTGYDVSGNELHLFPGVTAILFALLALRSRRRSLTAIYILITALAVELSFGVNTAPYWWLYNHVALFAGFRAPARFGALALCGLAVLAGLGWEAVEVRLRGRARAVVWSAALAVIVVECWSAPMALRTMAPDTPAVYKFLQTRNRPVIIELPLDLTPEYMYWSRTHWASLVNGYSGYTPPDYNETVALMDAFPDRASIAHLRKLDVRYILIHEAFYKHSEYVDLVSRLAARPDVAPAGRFRDWDGQTQIFELRNLADQQN
jgi:hypothetical protein